jgi:uncharacterized protein YcbX
MIVLGELDAIWRYPVKSLAAEPLQSTRVEADGLPGDRTAALKVAAGHARLGKPYRGKENNLLHTTPDARSAIAFAAQRGVTVTLESETGSRYFDDAPVSLIFDRWIAEVERALQMPLDPRRWRPNLYAKAATDFSFSEPELTDRIIEIGDTVLRVRDTIKRCVTTTYDVATGEPDDDVLLYVAQRRANVMGVYCDVELAGTVRVGDALRLRAR